MAGPFDRHATRLGGGFEGERIQSLDILRGLALLGMFVVHFHMRSTDSGGIDAVVRTLVWRLVESKSHGTFALLFGAGVAIQFRRASQRGRPFTAFYLRRLGVLASFGFAAHALLGYNVLLGYAAWGVPLLLICRWSTRALLLTALLSAISVPLYHLGLQQSLARSRGPEAVAAAYEARRTTAKAVNGAVDAAEQQDDYGVLLAARLSHMAWFYRQPFALLPGATLALFIVGLLLVRHRVFEDPRAHPRVLAVMAVFGLLSWLAANWLLDRWNLQPLALILRDQWLTFAFVAAGVVVLARWPVLVDHLRGVADAGRMALTNYLLQIAALDLLFSGYAGGLGTMQPVAGFAAALACFAVEVVVSSFWLARFRRGPAEWLWRSLTYGPNLTERDRT